jgi:hypothetical protein
MNTHPPLIPVHAYLFPQTTFRNIPFNTFLPCLHTASSIYPPFRNYTSTCWYLVCFLLPFQMAEPSQSTPHSFCKTTFNTTALLMNPLVANLLHNTEFLPTPSLHMPHDHYPELINFDVPTWHRITFVLSTFTFSPFSSTPCFHSLTFSISFSSVSTISTKSSAFNSSYGTTIQYNTIQY